MFQKNTSTRAGPPLRRKANHRTTARRAPRRIEPAEVYPRRSRRDQNGSALPQAQFQNEIGNSCVIKILNGKPKNSINISRGVPDVVRVVPIFPLIDPSARRRLSRTRMAGYIALARKWRSKQFADIVGQTAVVRALMNSIERNRVHHAYLFTGSRGIGKTSIARIFAKALRCPNAVWKEGWLSTCDQCSDCLEIQSGQSVNVLEIDGASNNGVDSVRELRENSRFLPSSGTRKIYIIDEVHMLSTAAFNALLKILEEPPEHVLFILATTEPHKIPSTILSRVQKFDLKRMTPEQIEHHLAEIARAEGISAEHAALALLARAAEGSMRDSLSLFDQVIAYAQGNVTATAVRESTGLVQAEVILEIVRAIFGKDPSRALAPLGAAYSKGIEMKAICRAILDALYVCLLLKLETPPERLRAEVTEVEAAEYAALLSSRSIEEIELFFQVFHHGYEALGRSPTPRLWLEVLILKCAAAEALVPVLASGAHSPEPTPPGPGGGGSRARASAIEATPAPMASAPVPPPEKKIAPLRKSSGAGRTERFGRSAPPCGGFDERRERSRTGRVRGSARLGKFLFVHQGQAATPGRRSRTRILRAVSRRRRPGLRDLL